MSCNQRTSWLCVCFLLLPFASTVAFPQPLPRVVASGLMAPGKLLAVSRGLLVAEGGKGPHTGRVSLIDRDGRRSTIIDRLPAGLAAPNNEPSGVNGLAFKNRTLFIAIGSGDSVINGPAPGSELPNPNRSSPILSSVLALELDRPLEISTGGFLLVPADHAILAKGQPVTLRSPSGETATLSLVVDIPDYLPAPRPDVPNNVVVSNPFGLEPADSCGLWLVDAARNLIWKINWCENTYTSAVSFPHYRNPLPIGAPMIDAVPTSARTHEGKLMVTFLTGFPFPPGLAEVRLMRPGTDESEVLFRSHRMLLDVLYSDRGSDGFYVLEFSADPNAMLPGRLIFYDSKNAAPVVVNSSLIGPTSMALRPFSDELLISEILTGRIVAVSLD